MLSVFVATRATTHLDVAARSYFRPHDVWGAAQIRADVLVEGLKPRNSALLLALVGLGASLRHRSWRPAGYALMIGCVTGAVTMLLKVLLQRTDPHHEMTAIGGSFPSGHVVSVLVLLGGVVLILREHSRWREWALVALGGLAMALALLLQAAHWLTDVMGGLLLGLTVLAVASAFPLRGPVRSADEEQDLDQPSNLRQIGRRPQR